MRDPLPPSSDVRTTSGLPPANRGRVLLETHLDLIQRKLRRLSRHSGLPDCEVEEFRSWALLKLIDDDCRILGKWEGRSSFPTFLTVVLTNLPLDEGGLGSKEVRGLFDHFQESFDLKALLLG